MLSIVLKHLERLQDELATIDPAHDVDAVDQVAAIASALRQAAANAGGIETAQSDARSHAHAAAA